jgi:hypothetical protein
MTLYECQYELYFHSTGQHPNTTNSKHHHACYTTSTIMIEKNNVPTCYFDDIFNILIIMWRISPLLSDDSVNNGHC